VALFTVCVWTIWASYLLLAVFSGFVSIVALCSALWGHFALRGVGYDCTVPEGGVFPGQSVPITRTIYNGKLLPLLWLELLEPCDPDGPVTPKAEFIVPNPDAIEENLADAWRCLYSFSLLKWHQTLTFSDAWTATRRGIHRIRKVTVRSGDGFGLCATSTALAPSAMRQIAVYPKLVDVSIDAVLADIWDSRSRSLGYLEDTTLLKSVRDYTARDSARRINQRLLARGGGLKVNQYEIVTPDDVLFVLDAASFREKDSEAFETVLSILASLITGLSRRGIRVGLIAPRSAYFTETYIKPSNEEIGLCRMLELLAAVSADNAPLKIDIMLEHLAPEQLGQTYYIAYSESAATSLQLLGHIPPHKAQLLAFEAGEASADSQLLRVRAITRFGGRTS